MRRIAQAQAIGQMPQAVLWCAAGGLQGAAVRIGAHAGRQQQDGKHHQ